MITATGQKIYTFFNDPGHGWLEVDRAEINELEIADKIIRDYQSYRKEG